MTIPAGSHVTVTATGTWSVASSNPSRTSDANGVPGLFSGGFLDPSAPAGTLIGSLDGGSTWFAIGAGPTTVNGPGTLILSDNDYSTNFGDNAGTLSVTITDPVSSLASGNGLLGGLDSQVEASLDGTNWAPAFVVSPNVYATPISGTQFVAQGGNLPGQGGLPFSGSDSSPAVDYYRIAFYLPASFSAPSISGLMKADNAAVAYLNGTQIGTQPILDTGNNWADPGTSFSSSNASLFHPGLNYLSFDLYNMGGPQGLDFKASVTFSPVSPDTTAPTDSPVVSPAPNGNGWNNSDVTVNWNWADEPGGSGIDTANCTQSSTSSGEGTQTLSSTCKDLAGNSASDSVVVKVDKTAPSIVPVVLDPNANPVDASQWSNQDLTVSFDCTDGSGSGVASVTAPQTISSDGITTVSGTCVDKAGNSSSASVDVKIDKTPPTITASATSGGNPYAAGTWTNQDVVVHYTCSDGTSGVASVTGDQTVSSEGDGQSTSGTCVDNAGNSASAAFSNIRIDKTAPSLDPSVSPDPVGLGFSATASPGASDSLSGVASASCDPVDTSALGSFTVMCTATDNAGNTATASASYDVTGIATKQTVLAAVQAAEATAPRHDAHELDAAARDLTRALDPALWTDPNHPASKRVFELEKQAVQEFDELLRDKHSSIADATLQSWTNSLVTLDRALASLAISQATGADAHQLAEAAKELARGDEEAAKGHLNDAIEHYGNAWQKVQEALKHHSH